MVVSILVFIKHVIEWTYFKLKPQRYFEFNGKTYPYLYDFYNATWTAERKIEIPIFLDIVQQARGEILEVGNVLKHYARLNHDVVDKYESYPGVVNEDIIDFNNGKKYDLIVSISTLEHVGRDEAVKDLAKAGKAVEHLLKLLKSGGKLVFSFPLGYSQGLDSFVSKMKGKNVKKFVLGVRAEGLTPRPPKKICIVEVRK